MLMGRLGGAAMKCSEIMTRNLEILSEKDTIQRAAETMANAGIGFLPICDARGRVIGVVTDRDLTTRGLAKKVSPATSAALVMSSPAVTCLDSADIREAEELMAIERKSRLVVVDAEEKVVGILSLADLVEKSSGKAAFETVRAVLWREALGPRGGAERGAPLLKDDPFAKALPTPSDDIQVKETVFTGGRRRGNDLKEFPG